MSGYNPNEEEDDDDYFSEVLEDVIFTGKEPKFVKMPQLDQPPADTSLLTISELVQQYRDIRDQLGTDRKGYKAREARMKTHLSILSMILTDRGMQNGVDSFSTPAGTAYKKVNTKYQINDWKAFTDYLMQTGNLHLVQKRVSPLAVKDVKAVDGALPPGITSFDETEFAVRAPTRKSK